MRAIRLREAVAYPMPPLPDSFLFGVSISDHQSEAYDERYPPDLWDTWERRPGVVARGRATDFWHRWREDVDNAHHMGCRAFRFSISWARVEPRPGEFDAEVLDHYRAIVLRLRELNMEPIVTLCHFVWPRHVEDRGGLRSEELPQWFAAYAARVRAALDPHVRYWITFNEPNILLQGFYKLWFQPDYVFPPGYPLDMPPHVQVDATIAVIRHVFEAHAAARRALRQGEGGERNLVSSNVFQLGLPPILQRLIDWNILRLKESKDWRKQFWRISERPSMPISRVDVIVGPAEQLEAEGFDAVFYVAGLGALVRRDGEIRTLADLQGRRVARAQNLTWEEAAAIEERFGRERVVPFDAADQAVSALNAGRVAAVIGDHATLIGLAHMGDAHRVLGERLTHQAYAVAVDAGHPALVHAVEHALRALQSEPGWMDLCRRYAPSLAEGRPAPSFDILPQAPRGNRLRRVQDRGKVIVGVLRADMPSFGAIDAAGRAGVEFDLGRALAGVIFGDASRVEFRRASPPRRPSLIRRIRRWIDELLRAYTIFSTFIASSWWYQGMLGKLPESLCPFDVARQLDFVSLDYYFGISAPTPDQLLKLARSLQREFNVTALWPDGLYHVLRYYHDRFPGLPIVIAENGFADEPGSSRRGEHIREHLRAVQRAVAEGIDVRAYCVWSITSNREWGLPHHAASDFGLYYVDMDGDAELKRQPTPGVEVYRRLIEQRDAS
ncbi:MAG TPA: family 1 glycosylhydrolase [Anaerolineae bacterium]|nr:family 1 glycosylhydrolase [Anaerolineae bacterium]